MASGNVTHETMYYSAIACRVISYSALRHARSSRAVCLIGALALAAITIACLLCTPAYVHRAVSTAGTNECSYPLSIQNNEHSV
eukprot:11302-Heterococcus_DN1.PRE.7